MNSAVECPSSSCGVHPSLRSTDGDSHSMIPAAFVITTKSDMFSASRRYRSSDIAMSRAARKRSLTSRQVAENPSPTRTARTSK